MRKEKNRIEKIINDAFVRLPELADTDMIVGKPIITAAGSTVIPISKITVGFLSGGGEYGEIKFFKPQKDFPLSGASGGVVSLKPSGFLVEKGKTIRYVHCPSDVFEKAYDTLEELILKTNEQS